MSTYDTWAAIGEIHRALQQITITADQRTRDGITPSELETLEDMSEKLGQMLAVEVA